MRARGSMAEQLENRLLLTGEAYVYQNTLVVDGDEFNNIMRVYAAAGSPNMTVEIDSLSLSFPLSSFGTVQIFGYDGNDLLYGEHNGVDTGKPFEFYGNGDNDTIYGTAGDDFIRGHKGGDIIYGYAGNDVIYGDEDNDSVYAGDGNDTVYGNFGGDALYGGLGDDSLMGGLGLDSVVGDDGDDRLFSGNGMDTVNGGAGNDYIESRGKADTVYGGLGNDTILSGAGSDLVYGEAGNDVIYANQHVLFIDTLDGGDGFDLFEADGNDVIFNMEGPIV